MAAIYIYMLNSFISHIYLCGLGYRISITRIPMQPATACEVANLDTADAANSVLKVVVEWTFC